MALKMSAAAAAEKWSRRLTAATPDYQAGIDRVTESPGSKAAAASSLWLSQVSQSEARFKNAVAAVDISQWKTAAKDKGGARLAQGAQASQSKMADRLSRIFPAIEAAQAKISSMPKTDIEARIARSAEFQRQMHKNRIK